MQDQRPAAAKEPEIKLVSLILGAPWGAETGERRIVEFPGRQWTASENQ